MEDYESDSSLSDIGSGFQTNVLLGYASEDVTDDTFSQLGGSPASDQPLPNHAAQCRICSSYMPLLLQLNANLPTNFPGHERQLYVWSCRRKTCRRRDGSVRGIRGVRVSKEAREKRRRQVCGIQKEQKQTAAESNGSRNIDLGSQLFGVQPSSSRSVGANPFSSNPFSKVEKENKNADSSCTSTQNLSGINASRGFESSEKLPETFAQKATLSDSPSIRPTKSNRLTTKSSQGVDLPHSSTPNQAKPYPRYNLDAEYEYLDSEDNVSGPMNANSSTTSQNGEFSRQHAALMDIEPEDSMPNTESSKKMTTKNDQKGSKNKTGAASSVEKSNQEELEQDTAHDRTFLHFSNRVAQNPEQILRYEFQGQPLLYSSTDAVGRLFTPSQSQSVVNNPTSKITTTTTNKSTTSKTNLPNCPNCGKERAFELQLMPHAITELEKEEIDIDGMEWGTIILSVCGDDCWNYDCDTEDQNENDWIWFEEWIGVQWEEVVDRK